MDHKVVDNLDAVLRFCIDQDDLLGSRVTLATVLAQRSLVRQLLPDAPGRLQARLMSTYAAQSRLAGWLAFDLNRYNAAAGHLEAARRAAHEAQDVGLAAFVLCYMSYLATGRGQARVALDHAVAAQGWADRTDDLRLRAFTWDRKAHALARDKQTGPALAAIDKAHALLDRADGGRPSQAYFLSTGGRLSQTESLCCLYLGDYDRGTAAAEDDLAAMNPSFARERASITLTLATCRLRATQRDVAGAAEAVRQAAALIAHDPSARVAQRLRASLTELQPWHDVPEVKGVTRCGSTPTTVHECGRCDDRVPEGPRIWNVQHRAASGDRVVDRGVEQEHQLRPAGRAWSPARRLSHPEEGRAGR